MARIVRTPVAPGRPVEHDCRDERGAPKRGIARSNQRCTRCNTWFVYVRNANAAKTTGLGK
jgi:hypothetical protein